MKRRFEKIETFLLIIFVALYVAAKVHFFWGFSTRSEEHYVAEHKYFWMGMGVVGGAIALLSWIKNCIEKRKSD